MLLNCEVLWVPLLVGSSGCDLSVREKYQMFKLLPSIGAFFGTGLSVMLEPVSTTALLPIWKLALDNCSVLALGLFVNPEFVSCPSKDQFKQVLVVDIQWGTDLLLFGSLHFSRGGDGYNVATVADHASPTRGACYHVRSEHSIVQGPGLRALNFWNVSGRLNTSMVDVTPAYGFWCQRKDSVGKVDPDWSHSSRDARNHMSTRNSFIKGVKFPGKYPQFLILFALCPVPPIIHLLQCLSPFIVVVISTRLRMLLMMVCFTYCLGSFQSS